MIKIILILYPIGFGFGLLDLDYFPIVWIWILKN
jgi:hypothetical protein